MLILTMTVGQGLEIEDLQRLYLEALRIMPNAQVWFFDEIQNIPKWELFLSQLYREKEKPYYYRQQWESF